MKIKVILGCETLIERILGMRMSPKILFILSLIYINTNIFLDAEYISNAFR